ncbi:MAG: hypothetical protein LBM19_02635 [Holosporales bacterium]|jgi:hypothetical protein|nr:hypothetical protein [Holosporales bacterium]
MDEERAILGKGGEADFRKEANREIRFLYQIDNARDGKLRGIKTTPLMERDVSAARYISKVRGIQPFVQRYKDTKALFRPMSRPVSLTELSRFRALTTEGITKTKDWKQYARPLAARYRAYERRQFLKQHKGKPDEEILQIAEERLKQLPPLKQVESGLLTLPERLAIAGEAKKLRSLDKGLGITQKPQAVPIVRRPVPTRQVRCTASRPTNPHWGLGE